MTDTEYKLEIAKLRAENATLKAAKALDAVKVTVTHKGDKTYYTVKGIPGTGWGISAEKHGWESTFIHLDTIKAQLAAHGIA